MKTPAKVLQQQVRNESYKSALTQWFTENRWQKVSSILLGQDDISLRVLEYLTDPAFVAECQRLDIPLSYYIETVDASTGITHRRLFNIHEQLTANQYVRRKKFMEPFARHNADLPNGGRFAFGYDTQKAVVETNVAQLQFMRFLVENNVIDWVRRHKDMILTAKSRSCR